MGIIKTFYSKDKERRAHIYRRKDGLIEIIMEVLLQEYYVDDFGKVIHLDDYEWVETNSSSRCITDSIEIAEKEILSGF